MSGRSHVVVALAVVTASVAACQESSEKKAEEAASAACVKELKQERAYRELEHGASPEAARALVEAQEADERAAKKQSDVVEAITREQDRFRTLLTKELAWVDRRVGELASSAATDKESVRADREREIAEARAWRVRLQEDLDAIDHPAPHADWTTLKTRIKRDLDQNRPASMPRMYEKSYGI